MTVNVIPGIAWIRSALITLGFFYNGHPGIFIHLNFQLFEGIGKRRPREAFPRTPTGSEFDSGAGKVPAGHA